jgi:hypothetical protein
MTPDPKRKRTDEPDELESEEMVNDSLGEETPSDATGLESEDEVRKRQRPA